MILAQIVLIPSAGVDAFQRFESIVLPLMPRDGGRLDRRLRSADGRVELHILSFPSNDAVEAYKADPIRVEHLHLLAEAAL
jgi:hypothetical protein